MDPNSKFQTGLPALRLSLRQHARLQAGVERSLAGLEYTLSQCRVLVELLMFPGLTHKQVAISLGAPASQVSRAVKPLLKADLICSEPARKSNQVRLSLTGRGHLVAREIDRMMDAALNEEFKQLSEDEQSNMFIRWNETDPGSEWVNDRSELGLRPLVMSNLGWILKELEPIARRLPYKDRFLVDVADQVVRYMRQPTYDLSPLLAVAHSGPVPFGVCLLRHDPDDVQARIELLYVSPAVRRQGVATKLVRQAIAEAKNLAMTRVTVTTRDERTGLEPFLRALGFKRAAETREVVKHGIPESRRDHWFDLGL